MVKWTEHAKTQLRHVHAHIKHDSDFYAKDVSSQIVQKSLTLADLPRRGRVVPELGEPNVREVPVFSYRLIYEIKSSHIDILALIHKRQHLEPDDIPRDQ